MLPTFTTSRLQLRPTTEADFDALHAFYIDPETMHFMPSLPHTSLEQTIEELQHGMHHNGACHWSLFLKETGALVGMVHFLGETAVPGMGYLLSRDYWGRGLIPEACRSVIDYGFQSLGYDRLELWIDAENLASQRVAQKLDFRLRGKINQRYPHETHAHVMLVYGITAQEWRKEIAPPPSLTISRMEPVLPVRDVTASVRFYTKILGFHADFLYGTPPTHAGISFGDWTGAKIVLQLSQTAPEGVTAATLYLFVDDHIDDLYSRLCNQNADIAEPLTDQPWGLREFVLRDPNGHRLRFGMLV